MADDRVLVVGNSNTTMDIYDPDSDTFSAVTVSCPTCSTDAEAGHAVSNYDRGPTLLADGKLLFISFYSSNQQYDNAFLFDPLTEVFTPTTGQPIEPYGRHHDTQTVLLDGRVLIVGGWSFRPNPTGGIITVTIAAAEIYDPATQTFTATGALMAPRKHHEATLLPDGKVLISGGAGAIGTGNDRIATTEIYDPATGIFTPGPTSVVAGEQHATFFSVGAGQVLLTGKGDCGQHLGADLYDHSAGAFSTVVPDGILDDGVTATLQDDGSVLVAGGDGRAFCGQHDILATYDPSSGQMTESSQMTTKRSGHTTTSLGGGKSLIAGGYNKTSSTLQSAEVYDAGTQTATATGSMGTDREEHTATLLLDGRVLIAGGYSDNADLGVASAELFDPATGLFTPTGDMNEARFGHTATRLSDGRVLIAAGYDANEDAPRASLELYDPAGGVFTPIAAPLNEGRADHTATMLADGRVLLAGGYDPDFLVLGTAELFDPSGAGSVSPTVGSMVGSYVYHTATLLPDGTVLIVGGYDVNDDEPQSLAEIFDPTTGTFGATVSMAVARRRHAAVGLLDGSVFVVGGTSDPPPLTERYFP